MLHPPPDTLEVPEVLPIFPLPRVVLLPGEVLPLHVFEPRYVAMVRDAIASHNVIGMVEVTPGHESEMPGSPPVLEIGCAGYIASHEELADGRFLMFLLGVERFRIEEELDVTTLYRQVKVHYEPTTESAKTLSGVRAMRQELKTLLPGLVELDESARGQFADHMDEVSDSQLIALATQILEIPSDRKRELLEADSLADRFLMVYEDLYHHLDHNPEADDLSPEDLN
jgi:Lon protease-like protein